MRIKNSLIIYLNYSSIYLLNDITLYNLMKIFSKVAKGVLYVGMDESNHGETKSRIGEIVVACCSFDKRYWEPRKHPTPADVPPREPGIWEGVDFVYTLLPHDLATKKYSNLPLVAPSLIVPLMHSKGVYTGKLALDGSLQREDKIRLLERFADAQCCMNITNYIKRNHVHYGPQLIYLAHIFANHLFRCLVGISEDERYIPFSVLNI